MRIDRQTDDELRRLAGDQGVSVNLLANKSLRKFAEWDGYGEKFGFVSLPSGLMGKLMDYLSEEQVKDLGVWVGKNLMREYVMFWFKEVSIEKVIEAFPRLFAKYGRAFDYEEHSDGPQHTAILKHNRGMKWSLYYAEVFETVFREILDRPLRVERSDNQIVARFRYP